MRILLAPSQALSYLTNSQVVGNLGGKNLGDEMFLYSQVFLMQGTSQTEKHFGVCDNLTSSRKFRNNQVSEADLESQQEPKPLMLEKEQGRFFHSV